MKIVLTSTSALHCFTWIIRRVFAEHHGRKKYVSGKYTYALRHTHQRQSSATIYKYQGLSTLINANRSWFDPKSTLDFPLKNDACLCATRTFSRQFGVRCYNVYCPMFLHLTLPSPCLQLTAYCTRFSHPALHRTHQSVSYIRTASRTVDRTAVAVLRSSTARPAGLAKQRWEKSSKNNRAKGGENKKVRASLDLPPAGAAHFYEARTF